VSNNSSILHGGGAYVRGGGLFTSSTTTLINSTVSANDAGWSGGGILTFSDVYLTLTDSTVSENTAQFCCGGIGNGTDSYAIITNSTVSGNTAVSGPGGGILNVPSATMTLTNSTVSGNSSNLSAGGIYNHTDSVTNFANAIVADNLPENCASDGSGLFNSIGYNLTDDTSCGFTATGDLVVADAMLNPLQNNGGPTETHDLIIGSPAIDAGSMDCPPPDTDQRGVARPLGAACDIGAVESLPEPGGSVMLVAGAAFLGLLYRRRASRFPLARARVLCVWRGPGAGPMGPKRSSGFSSQLGAG
jgi:hypothetical protein